MREGWGTRGWFEREFRASGEAADPWGHEWRGSQQVRHAQLMEMMAPVLDGGGRAAFDAGCSYGALTARLSRWNPGGLIVGLDLSERAVRVARRRVAGASFAVGALPDCALAPERFDLALASEVICYLPDEGRAAAVAAIGRALRPGGHLVFSNVLDDGSRYFTPDSALALLAPGFCIERVEYGYDRWYARWETPMLDLERRLRRGIQVLLDDGEFAAWREEHTGSAKAAWVRRARDLTPARAMILVGLRLARALIRWPLGWRWPVRLLAWAGRLVGGDEARTAIFILAKRLP